MPFQSISPGGVRTEIGIASGATYTPEMIERFSKAPALDSADVSSAVLYVLGTKPHVQVTMESHESCNFRMKIKSNCFRCMSSLSNHWVRQFRNGKAFNVIGLT